MNKTVTFTAGLVLVTLIGYLFIAGRGLLIPIITAIFIWHLLNTVARAIRRIPYAHHYLPSWLSMIIALILVAFFVKIVGQIIADNVGSLISAMPRYQQNLLNIFSKIDNHFHIKIMTQLNALFNTLNLQTIVSNIYGMFTTLTSSAVLITLYVIFLFIEQHFFRQKMDALFPDPVHRALVNNIMTHITNDTQTYLGIKTFLSLITAMGSFIVMKWVGLDFAPFWALLIFFLNFIPNIGAIIATAFPVILALIQFQSWIPFTIITSTIVGIQFVVGNLIEPRYLSQSLNLSPLVILFSLTFWGSIWGVLGMFLSVPITVMLMIVFAHFEKTRPISILLSQDGQVKKSYEPY